MALDRFEFILHRAAQFQIKRTKRFVQQQNVRLNRKRTRECHPLSLATRKFMWAFFRIVSQTDQRKLRVSLTVPLGAAHPGHAQSKANIFA
jgi:hypothetical protein